MRFLTKFRTFTIIILGLCLFVFSAFAQKKTRSNKQIGANKSVKVKNIYTVKKDIIVDEPVSPILYGSLVELSFGRSDNIWAEMLYNGDFERQSAYSSDGWLVYDRKAPQLEDWWHSGYEEGKWYFKKNPNDSKSTGDKVKADHWPTAHGKIFVTVDNKSKDLPVYYAQDSLYIKKNVGYHFSGLFSNGEFFSADKLGKSVDVTIGLYAKGDFSKPLVEKVLKINSNQFNLFEADLPAVDYQGRATFVIMLDGGSKVSFDLLSLVPANNVDGWKSDVIDMMKNDVPSGIIRFPGGCFASLYNWRDGVGPREERPVNYETWWGNVMTNDFGTVEYVNLCRLTKAEPFICVPVMFGTPENASDWVDFCNNPKNELRNRIGYPKTLNVKYWELDNETYRRLDAITYAKRCVEFAKAMKKVDPSIKLVMGNYWVFHEKFKEMLEIAYPYIDLITNRGGSMEELTEDLKTLAAFNAEHKTNIKLCHTEFRAPLERQGPGTDGLNKPSNAKEESLFTQAVRWKYGMNVLDQYLKYQRFGGEFAFANFVNYTDGWGENEINIAKEGPFLSAVGKTMEFLNQLSIAYPLDIEGASADSNLELQAAWNKEKNKLTLVVLNFSNAKKTLQFNLDDLGVSFKAKQQVRIVSASSMNAFNSPANKEAIKSQLTSMAIKKANFPIQVVGNSATAIEFEVK